MLSTDEFRAAKCQDRMMMMQDPEETTDNLSPRRAQLRLGKKLLQLRNDHDLTAQQLALMIGRAQSTITRLERAQRKPKLEDVMDLLEALQVSTGDQAEYIALARRATKRSWYQAPEALSERQRAYAEMESGVNDIKQYAGAYIPGLLQVAAYAEVRATEGPVYGDYDPQTVIAGRLARQKVISAGKNPARYHVLLDEAMLRRRTAPAEVLVEQLRHLLEVGKRENIEIRVVPATAPPPMNSFMLYAGVDPEEPTTVIIETATTDIGPMDEDEVAHYETLFEWLEGLAYGSEQSQAIITVIADEIEEEGGRPSA